jgi:endonuclease YncB( thermonuclease family)
MRHWRLSSVIVLGFFLSLTLSLSAQDFEGKVVSIADGDTISVMHNGTPEKIRLNGIDCPEMGQPFGNNAKQFASDMVFGKVVTIKDLGKDKYGRTIGDVLLPDGTNLNKELVVAGYAWWYRQYSNDKELEQKEQEARSSKKGLWADSKPIAPWDWRHNPTNQTDSNSSSQNTSATEKASNNDTVVYITETGSKYHNYGCRYLKSSIPIKLSEASTRYTPCSVCKPPTLDPNTPNQSIAKSTEPNQSIAKATEPNEKAKSDSSTVTVYVTKTGAKYHRGGCRYLKSSIPMSLKDAAQRYTPCSVCKPPTLDSNTPNQSIATEPNEKAKSDLGTPTGQTTPRGHQIYEGPRGGHYHYSKSGKKVYEKKK